MSERYGVRPAELDDIEAISAIAMRSWEHTYSVIYSEDIIHQFVTNAYSSESLSNSIQRDIARPQRLFHVALGSDGNIVAFSHVMPYLHSSTSFELARIYSLPQACGTGVGTSLLTEILETVPNLKELSAWVEQRNTTGRRFYERHHFTVAGEKEEDFFGHKTCLLKYVLSKPIYDRWYKAR